MPAFSPCCQQSPPTIRGIKGETGSDMTNNKSAVSSLPSHESLGSSCLSPSCALMSRGRAGDGFALCLRGSSGDETCRSVAFTGKRLPSQALEKPHQNQCAQPDPKDGGGGGLGTDGSCRARLQKAPLVSPAFPRRHFVGGA